MVTRSHLLAFVFSTAVLVTGIGVAIGGRAMAQESVNLSAPIVKPSTSTCNLDYLVLDIGQARIMATLKCNSGDVLQKVYDGTTTPTGSALISTLNTSNNSAGNSLIKKIYTRLIADGVLAGTVAGTPQ